MTDKRPVEDFLDGSFFLWLVSVAKWCCQPGDQAGIKLIGLRLLLASQAFAYKSEVQLDHPGKFDWRFDF
ncbi:hypothetical protein N9B88_03500 [Rubripirellula sp.]|nr:hypothetical protein [Rubripirellula sp.]